MYDHDGGESITEINPHANMLVAGKHKITFSGAGNKVDVISFTPDYQAMKKLLILYAAV